MKKVTIVMPCLNEEQTLEICILKAFKSIKELELEGEVIIVDNGSTDKSVEIATQCSAKVIEVNERGYGAALRAGIKAASYDYVIMGDADDSYDFSDIELFIEKLEEGYDLVIGNRFIGGIDKGAMPFSHRYIGNPVLSSIGRIFYKTNIGDFHCGMRAFRKSSIERLNLCTSGMEFASEMIVKAVLFNLKIEEVPCHLYSDGRNRPSHLRSIPDGLRHLLFLLIYCPKWLFLYPGILLTGIGTTLMLILFVSPIEVFNIRLETITMFYSSLMLLLGGQSIQFSLFTNIYGRCIGQFPKDSRLLMKIDTFIEKRGFMVAGLFIIVGGIGVALSIIMWGKIGFGELLSHDLHRWSILFGTVLFFGIHLLLSSFFVNVLHMGERE